jgi:DNA-binding transcriptional MerR regulator
MDIDSKNHNNQTYTTGAASRQTGVSQDKLRVWERRYGAVEPIRTESGRRLYRQSDISRLKLMKLLVDEGDAISSVANLTLEQLSERVRQVKAPSAAAGHEDVCHLALLGDIQASKLAVELKDDETLILSGHYRDKAQFLEEVSRLQVDLIVLEYSSLLPEHIKEIGLLLQRSGASRALVVYSFASSSTLSRLESDQVFPLRLPVEISEVKRLCHFRHDLAKAPIASSLESVEFSGEIPARRFSDEQLTKVALASVSIRCECPHHLVDIINSLSAFEHYSQQCEILNIDDAALHAMLHAATAHARSIIEASLERVIEIDGIELD